MVKGIPRSYFGQRFEEYHKLTSEILYLKCDAKITDSAQGFGGLIEKNGIRSHSWHHH
jgi:hypothetical protein